MCGGSLCMIHHSLRHDQFRFLCPPPTAILIGSSWWSQDNENPPRLTVGISGESSHYQQSGQVEWYTSQGTVIGHTGQPALAKPNEEHHQTQQVQQGLDWAREQRDQIIAAGRCVSKNLFINDADEKRKRVECLVRIQLGNAALLGTLASRGIKVISKPSKKRQSVKNMECKFG